MPKNGLGHVARPSVMQKQRMPAHGLGEAYAPERRRAPFAPGRRALGPVIGKTFAHVMQQHIGVGPDRLMRQMRLAGHLAGHEFGLMTAGAADAVEDLLSLQHFGVGGAPPAP